MEFCTSLSTQRQIRDTSIREIAWSFGRDRQNVFGSSWHFCSSGYLNTHLVSGQPLLPYCYMLTTVDLWLMPLECLHMTALEITHSKTEAEIDHLVKTMDSKVPEIADFTYHHRARLVKPMLSYDAAAIALSFLPASGEGLPNAKAADADTYTYHHLRRDMYGLCKSAGVEVASRYVVPSSHLTIARFVTQNDISSKDGSSIDRGKVQGIVGRLEEINVELRSKYWSEDSLTSEGSWIVGEEKGLDYRRGTLWYGGGHSHYVGKGFILD